MRGGRLVQLTAVGAAMAMLAIPMAQAAPSGGGVGAAASTGPAQAQSASEVDSEPSPEPALETSGVEVATTAVEQQPAEDSVTLTAPAGELRVVGVTWSAGSVSDGEVDVNYRTFDGDAWSAWEELQQEDLVGDESAERSGTEPVAAIDVDQVQVTVSSESTELLASVEMVVIDPGEDNAEQYTPPAEPATARSMAATSSVSTPPAGRPTIRSRASWGADESIRTWRPELGRVTGAVVHHTAGTNGYSSTQVPAIIRGIYHFHTVSRGWGDIGYNVLVDRFGRAWEGRYGGVENAVPGAHAKGANHTTFGISLMGNHDTAQVSTAAFRTVAHVIGWVFSWHGITTSGSAVGPNGRSINRIVGHRDVASTACPGRYMYPRLGELRTLVAQYQRRTPPRSQPPHQTIRLGGQNRYETAVTAQRWTHLISTTRTVFVATGTDYADALAAAPVASRTNSPVLLVRPDRVPPEVRSELSRTSPSRIYVLGGPDAISDSVVRALRGLVPRADVRRLDGANRYETAARVAQTSFGSVKEVFISSGEVFADAVSGSAAASRQGSPMYLTRRSSLHPATAAELRRTNPSRVRILGGEHVISERVVREVERILPNAYIQRLAGANRYETSAAVVRAVWPSTTPRTYYATGVDWPDALSAGWAAGARNAPVMLVRSNCIPPELHRETARLGPSHAFIVGGPDAVRDGTLMRRC